MAHNFLLSGGSWRLVESRPEPQGPCNCGFSPEDKVQLLTRCGSVLCRRCKSVRLATDNWHNASRYEFWESKLSKELLRLRIELSFAYNKSNKLTWTLSKKTYQGGGGTHSLTSGWQSHKCSTGSLSKRVILRGNTRQRKPHTEKLACWGFIVAESKNSTRWCMNDLARKMDTRWSGKSTETRPVQTMSTKPISKLMHQDFYSVVLERPLTNIWQNIKHLTMTTRKFQDQPCNRYHLLSLLDSHIQAMTFETWQRDQRWLGLSEDGNR